MITNGLDLLVVGDAASVNVQQWCEGLADAGAAVDVVSFEGQWCPDIAVHRLPSLLNLGRARYHFASPVARKIIARIAPDIVIGYYASGYGTIARLAARTPLVQVTAGTDVLSNPPGTLRHRVTRRNLHAANLIITWAPHMADSVAMFGVDRARIVVHPRGVVVDDFTPEEGTTGRGRGHIVSTRSLEHFYRADLLLHALAQARFPWQLTLIGDGSARPELQVLTETLRIGGRVRFAGRISYESLPRMLASHDVYVSVSPSDGVSASLLEAMATGLVPVVSNNPANRWWVTHGYNGLLTNLEAADVSHQLERAVTDDALRLRARHLNPAIVRKRADWRANRAVFMERLSKLAKP